MTMLKDNHIWSCGGDITKAVQVAKIIDIISRGDLTQGYGCLDYSLKIQK